MPHTKDRDLPAEHNSNRTREQITESHRPDKAREHLEGAFAGKENRGPASHPRAKEDHAHSTSVKSRRNEPRATEHAKAPGKG